MSLGEAVDYVYTNNAGSWFNLQEQHLYHDCINRSCGRTGIRCISVRVTQPLQEIHDHVLNQSFGNTVAFSDMSTRLMFQVFAFYTKSTDIRS